MRFHIVEINKEYYFKYFIYILIDLYEQILYCNNFFFINLITD